MYNEDMGCDESIKILYTSIIREIMNDGDIFIEVGVALGSSLIYFIEEMRRQSKKLKIYGVDTFNGTPPDMIIDNVSEHQDIINTYGSDFKWRCEENLKKAGVFDDVTLLQMKSIEASNKFSTGEIAAVFIDGSHYYEDVKSDIYSWKDKIRSKGIISGHDFKPGVPWSDEGVIKAVTEVFGVNGRIKYNKKKQDDYIVNRHLFETTANAETSLSSWRNYMNETELDLVTKSSTGLSGSCWWVCDI